MKFITLKQNVYDDNLYAVDKLINTMEPKLGTLLRAPAIKLLIQDRNTKVTINRAKT